MPKLSTSQSESEIQQIQTRQRMELNRIRAEQRKQFQIAEVVHKRELAKLHHEFRKI